MMRIRPDDPEDDVPAETRPALDAVFRVFGRESVSWVQVEWPCFYTPSRLPEESERAYRLEAGLALARRIRADMEYYDRYGHHRGMRWSVQTWTK